MPYDNETRRRVFETRMAALRRRNCLPPALLDLVAAVFESQDQAREAARVTLPPASELAGPEQRSQGAPLLVRESFPHDRDQARDLFFHFLGLLEGQADPLGAAARTVAAAVADGGLDLDKAFAQFLRGETDLLDQWAQRTPEAPRILSFLVQSAMAPGLARAARDLAGNLDAEIVWQHGHCPLCGSLPLVGELREKQGFKFVVCSFCGHDYRVPRLSCVFCGETETEQLAFFEVQEEPGFRVEVCKSCQHYIKVADFRKLDRRSLPLLDDLESLALDILAVREGYARPTLSGLGF